MENEVSLSDMKIFKNIEEKPKVRRLSDGRFAFSGVDSVCKSEMVKRYIMVVLFNETVKGWIRLKRETHEQ